MRVCLSLLVVDKEPSCTGYVSTAVCCCAHGQTATIPRAAGLLLKTERIGNRISALDSTCTHTDSLSPWWWWLWGGGGGVEV